LFLVSPDNKIFLANAWCFILYQHRFDALLSCLNGCMFCFWPKCVINGSGLLDEWGTCFNHVVSRFTTYPLFVDGTLHCNLGAKAIDSSEQKI
jgi:hypothetical protein